MTQTKLKTLSRYNRMGLLDERQVREIRSSKIRCGKCGEDMRVRVSRGEFYGKCEGCGSIG